MEREKSSKSDYDKIWQLKYEELFRVYEKLHDSLDNIRNKHYTLKKKFISLEKTLKITHVELDRVKKSLRN